MKCEFGMKIQVGMKCEVSGRKGREGKAKAVKLVEQVINYKTRFKTGCSCTEQVGKRVTIM